MEKIQADKNTPHSTPPPSFRTSKKDDKDAPRGKSLIIYQEAIEQQRRKSAIETRPTRETGRSGLDQGSSIKDYWSSAQATARDSELERINTLKQHTLSKYQSFHNEGHVRNQANYFQKLVMMSTPSMNNANKTVARGIKRLEQLAAANNSAEKQSQSYHMVSLPMEDDGESVSYPPFRT